MPRPSLPSPQWTALIVLYTLMSCGIDPGDRFSASPSSSRKKERSANSDGSVFPGPDSSPSDEIPEDLPMFRILNPMNPRTDGDLTESLSDVVTHLPENYGNTYYDNDQITWAHETTHAIQSYIRNYLRDRGAKRQNAFYVLENRYILIEEPNLRKSAVSIFVPQALQGPRYQLYLLGSKAWDDTPLYIWDEWNAYVNGSQVGIDLVNEEKWNLGWRDGVTGTIEFNIYALALAMAVLKHDPGYLKTHPEFKTFLGWNLKRGMQIFEIGRTLDGFSYELQDRFLKDFLSHPSAKDMRAFLVSWYGRAWCQNTFGEGEWLEAYAH